MTTPSPLRVAITGAAGQIGYALLFRIAAGELFGPDQPVHLSLIEIEPVLPSLAGVLASRAARFKDDDASLRYERRREVANENASALRKVILERSGA